jgi:hypothetical protein
MKQINRTLAAIAAPQASCGMVPLRAGEWEARLAPVRQPQPVNGHHYNGVEHSNGQEQAG